MTPEQLKEKNEKNEARARIFKHHRLYRTDIDLDCYADINECLVEIGKFQAENKRLKKALLIYGMHLVDCPCYVPEGKWDANDHRTKTMNELNIKEVKGGYITTVKCTCGFDQALKENNN